jgi:hypothetical protein
MLERLETKTTFDSRQYFEEIEMILGGAFYEMLKEVIRFLTFKLQSSNKEMSNFLEVIWKT